MGAAYGVRQKSLQSAPFKPQWKATSEPRSESAHE